MPKYIPGNPNIIIQNVAGAASLIAANQLYNIAKPDGLSLGAIYPALYLDQLVKRPEVKYDWNKFAWIGSPVSSNHMMYMRADTPYKTIDDVRAAAQPPKCGTSGVTSTGYYIPKLLEEAIGAKFDIVAGYQAGLDVELAVERGEVVCRSFTITTFHSREPFFTWRKKNFVRVLYQTGTKRDARLKEVPTMYEIMDRYKTRGAGAQARQGDLNRQRSRPADHRSAWSSRGSSQNSPRCFHQDGQRPGFLSRGGTAQARNRSIVLGGDRVVG